MTRNRRRQLLPKPGLQIRLTLLFVGSATVALLLQYILFLAALSRAMLQAPDDGTSFLELARRLAWEALLPSAFLVLPLTYCIGVLAMHRVAGPIYRFEKFLASIARGERPRDCRLRRGDQLQELCVLLNSATEPLRRTPAAPTREPAPPLESAVPSA